MMISFVDKFFVVWDYLHFTMVQQVPRLDCL